MQNRVINYFLIILQVLNWRLYLIRLLIQYYVSSSSRSHYNFNLVNDLYFQVLFLFFQFLNAFSHFSEEFEPKRLWL